MRKVDLSQRWKQKGWNIFKDFPPTTTPTPTSINVPSHLTSNKESYRMHQVITLTTQRNIRPLLQDKMESWYNLVHWRRLWRDLWNCNKKKPSSLLDMVEVIIRMKENSFRFIPSNLDFGQQSQHWPLFQDDYSIAYMPTFHSPTLIFKHQRTFCWRTCAKQKFVLHPVSCELWVVQSTCPNLFVQPTDKLPPSHFWDPCATNIIFPSDLDPSSPTKSSHNQMKDTPAIAMVPYLVPLSSFPQQYLNSN